jgi:hypothetical protein
MPRNHFSQKGGPYFINNGFSKHDHDHKPGSNHEDAHDIKPDRVVFASITIGFVIVAVIIASLLSSL